MVTPEAEQEPKALENILRSLAPHKEQINIPGRGVVDNLHNPFGMELKPYLDPEHLPAVTNFTTVIFSEAFAHLRGRLPEKDPPAEVEWGGKGKLLKIISTIAADEESYRPTPKGKLNRQLYLKAMCEASKEHFVVPVAPNEVIVPIERCGGNIARALNIKGVSIEIKRLRFKDHPDLLGAGINLDPITAEKFRDKRVRLLEGIVASGSTKCVFIAALKNLGIGTIGVDCDAVVVCPAGAEFCLDFGNAVGYGGSDVAAFAGGILNPNWYAIYHAQDSLRDYLGMDADKFVGKQVIGDGGDLTSI